MENEFYSAETEEYEAEGGLGEVAVGPGTFLEGDQINCVAFDVAEESIWIGTASGTLSQLMSPTVERYSVFPAHNNSIIDLCSIGSGALSVSPGQLQLHTTGCAPHIMYNDLAGDLTAVHLDSSGRRALVGRAGGALTSVDLVTGKPGSTVDTGGKGVVALRGPVSRGSLVVGTADGCVSLLDARDNYRAGRTILAHAGGLAAVDAHGDLVATCGYSGRMGQISLEYTVKVFDVRMAPRLMAAVPFAAGPTMVHFLPNCSSSLLVGAASGEFAFMDVQGGESNTAYYAVDTGGEALLCCDISSSGECIAFGGMSGYVHLWAYSEEPVATIGGEILEHPDPPPPPQPLQDGEPVTNIPPCFPADGWSLASQLDYRQIMSVGLRPRVIDPSLLQGMKQSDFVGYIQNPKVKRGGKPGESAAAVAPLRNQRLELRPEAQNAEEAKAERARQRADKGGIILPGRYRRVIIKQQTGIKFEEFDFSFYNRTPFVGLENDLANCYTNALLQLLFFTPPMREVVMRHVPDGTTEFSLTCELSFLFRLLATPGASVCQAANLLRALRQSREASVLGLLEGVKGERGSADIEVETHKDKSLSRRLQSLSRFLLEQLSKEETMRATQQQQRQNQRGNQAAAPLMNPAAPGGPDTPTKMEEIFGVFQKQRTRCLSRTPRPDQEKFTRTFQVDLQYPELSKEVQAKIKSDKEAAAATGTGVSAPLPPPPAGRPSFAEVLQRSLHTSTDLRAWFDSDSGYQFVRQERTPTSLPQTLVVGCGMQDRSELLWWQPVEVAAGEPEGAEQDGEEGRRKKTRPWLPFAVSVTSNLEEWRVAIEEGASAAELKAKAATTSHAPTEMRAVYELTGLIAHIVDEDEAALAGSDYEGHMLAHIKVPPAYYEAAHGKPPQPPAGEGTAATVDGGNAPSPPSTPVPGAATTAQVPSAVGTPEGTPGPLTPSRAPPSVGLNSGWVVFNDFHITPCLPSEVGELYGGQKIPSLLYFTRVDVAEEAAHKTPAPPVPVLNPSAFLQLCRAPPMQKQRYKKPKFVPLGPHEMPHPGMLLGLDAEFVAYSPPEKVVRRGIEVEARPSRLGLARVSLVRGSGSASGVCCIDDYIRNVEPVYDYLTRYSGLVPGDLDPAHSPHHLTTLRQAYLKLRYLVDAGVVFVGHGLKKDFRMINIVVPPHQVIDTVDLFYKERGRRLSLRFLASFLLGANIQTETHDSIEDAVTAVRLYDAYRGLVEAGKLEQTLADIYEWGIKFGWDPGAWAQHPKTLEQQQRQQTTQEDHQQQQQQQHGYTSPAALMASMMSPVTSPAVPPGAGIIPSGQGPPGPKAPLWALGGYPQGR